MLMCHCLIHNDNFRGMALGGGLMGQDVSFANLVPFSLGLATFALVLLATLSARELAILGWVFPNWIFLKTSLYKHLLTRAGFSNVTHPSFDCCLARFVFYTQISALFQTLESKKL